MEPQVLVTLKDVTVICLDLGGKEIFYAGEKAIWASSFRSYG